MPIVSKAQIAWAAGLFEGEGTIVIQCSRHNHGIRMSLGMSDRDVVERFAEVVGCGTIYEAKQRDPRHKTMWRWQCGRAAQVIEIVDAMRPWLGQRRTTKADEVIAWARSNLGNLNPDVRAESYRRRIEKRKATLLAMPQEQRTETGRSLRAFQLRQQSA